MLKYEDGKIKFNDIEFPTTKALNEYINKHFNTLSSMKNKRNYGKSYKK